MMLIVVFGFSTRTASALPCTSHGCDMFIALPIKYVAANLAVKQVEHTRRARRHGGERDGVRQDQPHPMLMRVSP
eukprot:3478002-Amphidinium_carterae.5